MKENDRKSMIILADTIQGEINRMCVTNDLNELDEMYRHANTNLDKLLSMIYEKRFILTIGESVNNEIERNF